MAHTPGPWFAFRADYQGRPDEAPIFVVGPGEFQTVAQVRAGSTDDDLPAQTPDNARLIAAAPELLSALREYDRLSLVIESAVRHEHPVNPSANARVVAAIKAARAAIAKAEAA